VERIAAGGVRQAATLDQCAAEHTKRTKRSTVCLNLNSYKMIDPVRFCGCAKELDRFLDLLRSNFNSHGHLFPSGGPNQFKYVIPLLDTGSNHQKQTLRQIAMTETLAWAGD
jgi:hypothetical protein